MNISISPSPLCSHTPSALNEGAKRSGATCHMTMPQCCSLAKGAKRPSHTTNMLSILRLRETFCFFGQVEIQPSGTSPCYWHILTNDDQLWKSYDSKLNSSVELGIFFGKKTAIKRNPVRSMIRKEWMRRCEKKLPLSLIDCRLYRLHSIDQRRWGDGKQDKQHVYMYLLSFWPVRVHFHTLTVRMRRRLRSNELFFKSSFREYCTSCSFLLNA